MKITDVRTILLTGPMTNDPFLREARTLRSAAFIEVVTDGPTGLGETYAGYFCPELVPGIVEFFRPILIGQTVDDIPELWRRMYRCGKTWCRVGLGTIVLNGIEAALWDLKGKLLGQPVHALLGGRRHDRLPAYATGGPSNYPKDRLAAKIDHYLSLGFRGMKVGAGSYSKDGGWYFPKETAEAADYEADKLAFMRSHMGKQPWLMMDGHMDNSPGTTWTVEMAKAVARAVEPFDLFFLEEPLPYTDPWGYAELCRATSVPIAGGECLTAAYEWKVFIEQDCFDMGQPDAAFTGGIGEFMKVAEMLAARDRKVVTHAAGAGGSLMQNVHAGFAAANTCMLEVLPDYGPLHSEVVDGGFVMKDGYVLPPDRPGLGIVLTDEIRRRFPFVPDSGEYISVPGKILKDWARHEVAG
ncbi:MAG: mandelate racemase/muconate lactonizing enzyme family protein [Verrucomicrobia bacterium]|nr:mandelate racemase/muconate lactonizing enzyme family protein [Verrucomicrobiota bacterium]